MGAILAVALPLVGILVFFSSIRACCCSGNGCFSNQNHSEDDGQRRRRIRRLPASGRYTGNTYCDLPHGHGMFRFPNGDVYVGQFDMGVMHGQGTLTYANGSAFEGQFRDGSLNGPGLFKYPNGIARVGVWIDNVIQEQNGQLVWPDRSKYYGDISKEGSRHGMGVMIYANGSEYRGMYQNNQKCGFGKYTENGSCYEGQFLNDLRHGEGVLSFQDGSSFKGTFMNDQMHGFGIFTSANGKIEKGEWVNGELLGASSQSSNPQITDTTLRSLEAIETDVSIDDIYAGAPDGLENLEKGVKADKRGLFVMTNPLLAESA